MTSNLRQQSDQAALRARAIIVWLAITSILSVLCIGAVMAGKAL